MKFKVTKENLVKGIQTVQNVVSNKITLPILSNILIETKGNVLQLNATDLDIEFHVKYLWKQLKKAQ